MAAKSASTIGSSTWISAEKENVLDLLRQEKEEIVFPAQHELEWLNEHMAEIFSRSHVDIANVFKTPGKLRGKTPRTARKRVVPDTRIPLSDVFASKPILSQSPNKQNKSDKPAPRFVIARDETERVELPSKSQTDSGYHGSSQDEMEVDEILQNSPIKSPVMFAQTPVHLSQGLLDVKNDEVRTTGSFHSAKEDQTTKTLGNEEMKEQTQSAQIDKPLKEGENTEHQDTTTTQETSTETQPEFDDIGSPSDESTPDRPLVRKSSLNFASLPAREPLKTSIGTRISRTSILDQVKTQNQNIGSQLRKSVQYSKQDDLEEEEDLEMKDNIGTETLDHEQSEDESGVVKQYSKASTLRLHEKIDMLGKAPAPRPSKSIPSAFTLAAIRKSEAAAQSRKNEIQPESMIDDDDDWIKPLNPTDTPNSPVADDVSIHESDNEDSDNEKDFDVRAPELIAHEERMKTPMRMSPSPGKKMPGYGHTKSASTVTLMSPEKQAAQSRPSPAKSISVSNPQFHSTTPQGSPRRYFDGTLSASKSKLQSIMKTAKGLFTSSAGVSAAAKLETLSPDAVKLISNTMPGMYPSMGNVLDDKPLPASPPKEVRKTRSSTEREKEEKRHEKETKAMQKMNDQLDKAREKEKQKAAQQKQTQEKAGLIKPTQPPIRTSPRRVVEDNKSHEATEMQPPSIHQAASKSARPVKPAREPIGKTKPAPVSIRVGTLSQRMPMNTSSITSSTQETLPAEPKRPGLTKKTSTASMQSSVSSTAFKTSVNAPISKPRALLAAERKKEQDGREAQRKLEQKKEMERKRAAQQEEAKKQEQRQRAEAERKERERIATEQAKRQAQQQAIERKRQENARKAEQQRQERAAASSTEAASGRPPSRIGGQALGRSILNHNLPTNPAKPAKRPLEEDHAANRAQASKYGGAASQQADAKRRKTEDENVVEHAPRPTMSGAPIRQSHLGKKPSIFNHGGYAPAPSTHLSQFPPPPNRVHPQISQFGNGNKIPFADAPNPPAQTKTPLSSFHHKTIQTVKSSPQYPNGDAIHLPEIPTDSEDEDSDDDGNAFPIPDWATPGHLNAQLMRQEGIDGDAVFGPIAPLKMEEVFAKSNKDRLKRLRDRTSSANWILSGDGLTLEEVRTDREQRERMRVDGGWRFGS